MSDAEQMRAVVMRLNPARDAQDVAAVAELLTDDVEYVRPGSFGPDPIVGRDEVAPRLAGVGGKYFDPASMRREILRVTIENDVAAVEQTLNCQSQDGNPYSNVYVWIYEFRDNKIRRLTEYADTLSAAQQLGIVP